MSDHQVPIKPDPEPILRPPRPRVTPKPTSYYMKNLNYLAGQYEPFPKRLLVVLDLNGTILKRAKNSQNIIERAELRNFINYLLQEHHVLIWSSALPKNVEEMCRKFLSPAQIRKLVGIWGRDTFNLTGEEYSTHTQVYKKLELLWDDW
jgi:hypothetical protein